MMEFYKLNEKNHTVDHSLGDHREAIMNLGRIITSLVENAQIQQALEYQDELDRNTISLMGYKEQQTNRSVTSAGGGAPSQQTALF